MFTVRLVTDLPEKIAAATARMDREQAALLQGLGTYILQEQKFSFDEKGSGGGGADGVRWKPLTEATEIAKNRKLKSFRDRRARAKKLMGQLKTAKTAEKRRSILDKLQKARNVPRTQIGVDTGLLRNSVTPGYSAPDGSGGNIFKIEGTRVTVGYGRSYAEHFDAQRKLMPDDGNLPDDWVAGLERIAANWLADILKDIT